MRKPPKAAFDHPTARQHNKAFLSGFAADHVVAHAMEVGPFAAAIGGKATIEDSQPQARPVRAAAIKRRERVALLHRSRNGVDRQPDAIRINQGHTLAPNHHLGRVIAPRTAMHVTVCVSMIPRVGVERRPAARRRRTATSYIRRSNRPSESQRRNQPYTVRHGGRCDGKARQGPPTRRCQASARTTASVGVAASLRGGSARSSQRTTVFSAHCDTISFRRGSCRARCSFVHIQSHRPVRRTSSSITENEMGIEEHNCTQTGSKWLAGWRFSTNPTNERTMIATVFPAVGAPHMLPLFLAGATQTAYLIGAFGSMVFDYVLRQKMSRQG